MKIADTIRNNSPETSAVAVDSSFPQPLLDRFGQRTSWRSATADFRALEIEFTRMSHRDQVTRLQSILRAEFSLLAVRYGVCSLGLFGSTVRGETHPGSDVDILVRFDRTPGLLRFIELENHLSDLLGLRVDLVMADALRRNIGKRIMAEVVPV